MSEKPFLRVRVSRSATVPSAPDAWEKAEYAVEADVPAGMSAVDSIHELESELQQIVAEFQGRVKRPESSGIQSPGIHVAGPPPPLPPGFQSSASPEPTPELDPAYLERLPWTPFDKGGGAWIFRDTPGAKALSEELAKQGGVLTIGNYRYKITQGRDREFINRFQVGKKS